MRIRDEHAETLAAAGRLEQLAAMLRSGEARLESVEMSFEDDRAEYFGNVGAMSVRCAGGRETHTTKIRIGSDEERALHLRIAALETMLLVKGALHGI